LHSSNESYSCNYSAICNGECYWEHNPHTDHRTNSKIP
jgi:radical SAM protein with 4Fe4S-binding SPASM domain